MQSENFANTDEQEHAQQPGPEESAFTIVDFTGQEKEVIVVDDEEDDQEGEEIAGQDPNE